jgi:hypothetical protein
LWTQSNIFSEVPYCPFCGGSGYPRSDLPSLGTSIYVEKLLESFGFEQQGLLSPMLRWECEACATQWFNPWFNLNFIASGYGYLVGRHIYGWAALGSWVVKKERPYFAAHFAILEALLAIKPDLRSYGEVNCPFSGLAFGLAECRNPELDRSVVFSKINAMRCMYASTELKRDYTIPAAWKSLHNLEPTGQLAHLKTILINEPSPICWGAACTFAGASCHALAHGLLFDQVGSVETLLTQGTRLDAVGLFNVLDHFVQPMKVLDRLFEVTDLVVLELAALDDMDHQHPLNIGSGFSGILEQRGLTVTDITERAFGAPGKNDQKRYFVVSRDSAA